jgi:hypothetical protein
MLKKGEPEKYKAAAAHFPIRLQEREREIDRKKQTLRPGALMYKLLKFKGCCVERCNFSSRLKTFANGASLFGFFVS